MNISHDIDDSFVPELEISNRTLATYTRDGFMPTFGGDPFEICIINPDGTGYLRTFPHTEAELRLRLRSVDGFDDFVREAQEAYAARLPEYVSCLREANRRIARELGLDLYVSLTDFIDPDPESGPPDRAHHARVGICIRSSSCVVEERRFTYLLDLDSRDFVQDAAQIENWLQRVSSLARRIPGSRVLEPQSQRS